MYSEDDLEIHELLAHFKCEVCSEYFDDNATRARHLADVHGKMYLSKEEPIWQDGLSELVDIPLRRRTVARPESTPYDLKSRQEWLMPFAQRMGHETAAGRAENLLRNPPTEFRDQAQYVNWVEVAYPRSAKAWESARYRKRQRSKAAKGEYLAHAWAYAEHAAPSYLKQKGF